VPQGLSLEEIFAGAPAPTHANPAMGLRLGEIFQQPAPQNGVAPTLPPSLKAESDALREQIAMPLPTTGGAPVIPAGVSVEQFNAEKAEKEQQEFKKWVEGSPKWTAEDHAEYRKVVPYPIPDDVQDTEIGDYYLMNEMATGVPAPVFVGPDRKKRQLQIDQHIAQAKADGLDPQAYIRREQARKEDKWLPRRIMEAVDSGAEEFIYTMGVKAPAALADLAGVPGAGDYNDAIATRDRLKQRERGIEAASNEESYIGGTAASAMTDAAHATGELIVPAALGGVAAGATLGGGGTAAAAQTASRVASLGLMGGNVGVRDYIAKRQEGWNRGKAAGYGIFSAARETITEIIGNKVGDTFGWLNAEDMLSNKGLDTIRKAYQKGGIAKVVANVIGSTTSEGGEEGLATVVGGVQDAIFGVQGWLDKTGDEQIKELGYSMLVGALAGGYAHIPAIAAYVLQPSKTNRVKAGIPEEFARNSSDRQKLAAAIAEANTALQNSRALPNPADPQYTPTPGQPVQPPPPPVHPDAPIVGGMPPTGPTGPGGASPPPVAHGSSGPAPTQPGASGATAPPPIAPPVAPEPPTGGVELDLDEMIAAEMEAEEAAEAAAQSGQNPAASGQPDVELDSATKLVNDAFPDAGLKVERSDDKTFKVTMPSGQHFSLQSSDELKFDEKAIVQNLKNYGLEDTPENRAAISNVRGSFQLSSEDGDTSIDGVGLIAIKAGLAESVRTARHEALHMVARTGMMTDQEFNSLWKQYAPDAPNREAAEEAIAYSVQFWEANKTKIEEWIDKLLNLIGVKKSDADAAVAAFLSGEMFSRSSGGKDVSQTETQTKPKTQAEIEAEEQAELDAMVAAEMEAEEAAEAEAAKPKKKLGEKAQAPKPEPEPPAKQDPPSTYAEVNTDAIPAGMEVTMEAIQGNTDARVKVKLSAREAIAELDADASLYKSLLECLGT
jgi:hypothetical protein